MSVDFALAEDVSSAAAEVCERVYGDRGGAFLRAMNVRLRAGEAEYGDAFLTRTTNVVEALEEPPDVANYWILELQRVRPLLNDEDWWEIRQGVVGIIAKAIHLDQEQRRLAGLLTERLPETPRVARTRTVREG